MDKPLSLSVKQFLIRRTSVDMAIAEKTVEAVINHQFASMLDAMSNKDSVEMSGFGKFLFNSKKAVRLVRKYTDHKKMNEELLLQDISPQKRRSVMVKLQELEGNIEMLKPRVNETKFQADI